MKILVAGIGNIFLGDDGFGAAVAARLAARPPGSDIEVVDFGIRGVHLAYALADGGYAAAILVDAVARGGAPGTLYAIEPELGAPDLPAAIDAHGLTPDAVLAMATRLGGSMPRVVVVGCEPAAIDESMDLSAPVAAAIDGAIDMIDGLVAEMRSTIPCA